MSARISIAALGVLGVYFFVGAYFPRIMGRDTADLTGSILVMGVGIMGLATASVLTMLQKRIALIEQQGDRRLSAD